MSNIRPRWMNRRYANDSDVCDTAGQNREKNRGASALPGQWMMADGTWQS